MTAEDTALRIMRWAANDMRAEMPEGDLTDAVRLAEPRRELLVWAGRLAAVTAARLRLTGPLFGERTAPGHGVILLAAAVGCHQRQRQADLLLRAVPAPARAASLLAHHGLVELAAPLLPRLADRLRDVSPLSGVLDRPGARTSGACEDLLDRLRTDPGASSMVRLRFGAPADSPAQARWRGECLTYIRHEDPDFVLDVYDAALFHHGREHEIRARAAWLQVVDENAIASVGGRVSESAVSTASWWRALAEIEAAAPQRIRARRHLAGRRIGTNLYRRVEELGLL